MQRLLALHGQFLHTLESRDLSLGWAPTPCSLPGAGFAGVTRFLRFVGIGTPSPGESYDCVPALGGRLRLENFIALRERNPGLFAPGPDMPCRSQPGGIVERARTHADHAIPRHAANPAAALRTY